MSCGKLELLCFYRIEASFPVFRYLRRGKLGNRTPIRIPGLKEWGQAVQG